MKRISESPFLLFLKVNIASIFFFGGIILLGFFGFEKVNSRFSIIETDISFFDGNLFLFSSYIFLVPIIVACFTCFLTLRIHLLSVLKIDNNKLYIDEFEVDIENIKKVKLVKNREYWLRMIYHEIEFYNEVDEQLSIMYQDITRMKKIIPKIIKTTGSYYDSSRITYFLDKSERSTFSELMKLGIPQYKFIIIDQRKYWNDEISTYEYEYKHDIGEVQRKKNFWEKTDLF